MRPILFMGTKLQGFRFGSWPRFCWPGSGYIARQLQYWHPERISKTPGPTLGPRRTFGEESVLVRKTFPRTDIIDPTQRFTGSLHRSWKLKPVEVQAHTRCPDHVPKKNAHPRFDWGFALPTLGREPTPPKLNVVRVIRQIFCPYESHSA